MNNKPQWLQRLASMPTWQIILLICVWLGFTAGLRHLTLPDEGRYIGVAWEMLQSGQMSVPLLDGMPFFHKPPLFYWLTSFGLHLFGNHEWSGRFASFSGACALASGLYLFVRHYRGPVAALLVLLVLLTQPFLFVGAQFANLDMLVASMISLTILCGAHAVLQAEKGQSHRIALLGMYSFVALGLLAKGLIGIVLPGAVILAWLLLTRRWRSIVTVLWLPGIALFLLLGMPWFLYMQKSYSGFYDYFFIYHHFQRFSQTGFNNQHPFWFYVPVLLLLTAPWSPWLWKVGRKPFWQQGGVIGDVRLLMALWLVVILVFFSLPSSKLVGYIMPALAPLAFLIADAFAERIDSGNGVRQFRITGIIAALVCVGSIAGVSLHDGGTAKPLALTIKPVLAANDQVVMLDEYQYDLPFYLALTRPAWVVSDWDDPGIPKHDNWRKELFDAGKFDHPARDATLLTPAAFSQRLCRQDRNSTLWIWGREHDATRYPVLTGVPLFGRHGEHRVWRISGASLPKCP